MLPNFSIKKPYTIIVGVIIVLILGGISFLNLETDLLPEMDLPFVVVMTNYRGASPEEVETIVTRPIEQSLGTINNLKTISSTSRENSSMVVIEFNNDANMDSSIIEINSKLDLIKGFWNENVSSPMIMRLNPDMLPVMIGAVDIKDKDIKETSQILADEILPELEAINGVASIEVQGQVEEEIEILISREKIDHLNNKLLEEVDKGLHQAKSELISNKNKINKAKEDLAREESKQLEAMAQGKQGLLDKIQDLEKTIEGLAMAKSALESGDLTGLEGLLDEGGQNLPIEELSPDLLASKEEEVLALKSDLEAEVLKIDQAGEALKAELEAGKSQLIQGERAIDEGLKSLQAEEEKAFEKASLDGVISEDMIRGVLMGQNFSMPAGYIVEDDQSYVVKVGDKIKDLEELKSLFLFDTGVDSVGEVYLDMVADVDILDNSKEIYAKVNGNDALMLNFQKQSGYSTSEVSKNIWAKLVELEDKFPGLSLTALMDQGEYIDIVVDSVLKNIVYGGLLAILVLIIFLKDFKPTIIISLSVPISIIFAVALMYFTKVSINIISLAGLALGVGMLVDNSIVVIENIYRLRSEGHGFKEAALVGAREVAGAILASTITTACVFLPIVFTKGISRQLFADMGLTISYSLLASLIVALTLVPMMSSRIFKNLKEKDHKFFTSLTRLYEKALGGSLKAPILPVILSFLALGLSLFLASKMGTAFIPEMDAPQMSARVTYEKRYEEETKEKLDRLAGGLAEIDDIDSVGTFKGQSFMGGGNSENLDVYILLKDERKMSNKEIELEIERLSKDLGLDLTVDSSNMDMSQMGGSGIELVIKGRDLDRLKEISKDMEEILKNLEGSKDVTSDANNISKEVKIQVDKNKAMEEGLSIGQVYSIVSKEISKSTMATEINTNNKDYPVFVLSQDKRDFTREDLENIELKEDLLLKDLAEIKEESGLLSIARKDQQRYITVNSGIETGYNIGLVSRELENILKDYELEEGYRLEITGENEMINNSLRDLLLMLGLAVVLIYLIMVAQFQSLLSPFIVMFTIPLAFTGGLFTLYLTNNDLSLIAMLGFLVLSGVVVNNGIVFVDYANQVVARGHDLKEALIITGTTRLRPILMTAITTILGLFTLALGVGNGAEMLQPLALVAIGGLAYATILTLFVVPSMYMILNRRKHRRLKDEKIS